MEENIVDYIRLAVAYNAHKRVFAFHREEIIEEATSFFCQEIWQILRKGKYNPKKSALNTFCRLVVTNRFVSFTKRYLNKKHKRGLIIQRSGSNKSVKIGSIGKSIGLYQDKGCFEEGTHEGLSDKIGEYLIERGFLVQYIRAFIEASQTGEGVKVVAKRLGVTHQNVSYHFGRMKSACREYLEGRMDRGI